MIHIPAMAVFLTGLASAAVGTEQPSLAKVLNPQGLENIRREVETLRGKKFVHEVPVHRISKRELRALSDHELDKE